MIIYVIAFCEWVRCVPDDGAVNVQSIAYTLARIPAALSPALIDIYCLTKFVLQKNSGI